MKNVHVYEGFEESVSAIWEGSKLSVKCDVTVVEHSKGCKIATSKV